MKRCAVVQKAVDYSQTEAVVQWTNVDACDSLIGSLPPSGTGLSQRIGNRIRLVRMHLRGRWGPSKSNVAAVDTLFVKFAIVFDRQCNGTEAVYGDVYAQHEGTGVTSSSFNSYPNLFNEDRFRILFEKNFTLPAIGIGGAFVQANAVFSLTIPPLCFDVCIDIDEDVVFKGTSGDYTDVTSGNILVVNVCNLNVGNYPVSPWGVDLAYRLEFEDC